MLYLRPFVSLLSLFATMNNGGSGFVVTRKRQRRTLSSPRPFLLLSSQQPRIILCHGQLQQVVLNNKNKELRMNSNDDFDDKYNPTDDCLSRSSSSSSSSAAAATIQQQEEETSETQQQLVTYEVCLSPACVADGARKSLDELRALAPPNVIIKEGVCSSICGNGPVIKSSSSCSIDDCDDGDGENNKNKKNQQVKTIRKVKGQKILDLLLAEGEVSTELVDGYNLVMEGDEAFEKKDYQNAVELYEKAVDIAFTPAMELQSSRDRILKKKKRRKDAAAPGGGSNTNIGIGLDWLVRARRNEALARLELGDVESAILAAQASCNVSKNTSSDGFAVLARAYKFKGDAAAELETLKTFFATVAANAEAEEVDKLPFAKQNERRLLQLRMQKLEQGMKKK